LRRSSSRGRDPRIPPPPSGYRPERPRATPHVQRPERDQSMACLRAADDLDAAIE
jgi:hypothetical protein